MSTPMKEEYIKDRNEAMMAYPDTTKLDALVKKYPEYFDERMSRAWEWLGEVNPASKVRTLGKMITMWRDAPQWLIDKVNGDDEKSESGLIDE